MVKNTCFLLGGHRFKFRGVGYVHLCRLYQSLHGGGPLSHKQGVSYTNLVSGLAVTLKLDYYYYYYHYAKIESSLAKIEIEY
jgi:hypothetical protein